MQDTTPVRSRPVADKIFLIVAIACIGIAVARFALVVVTVPYAAYVSQRQGASDKSIAERVKDSRPWVWWWSDRAIPYREGGDYLGVMSHHKTSRNIGCVLGVITAQDAKRGIVMKRVITPEDRTALYGEESGNLMVRADGTTFRTGWAPPSRDAKLLSDVPVIEKAYNPVLTAGQAAQIEAQAGLVERSRHFYVGQPVDGGSGTWVLHARPGDPRTYILIPLELSPAAGVL